MSVVVQNKEALLSTLLKSKQKIKSYGISKLSLFGSFADNNPNSKSDVDLLVEFDATPVPEAFALMKKARNQYALANVFAFAGGAAAGYTLSTALSARGNKSHVPVGVGAAIGLIGVAIPISISSTRKMHRAVGLYNESLGYERSQSYTLHTTLSENGITLLMKF